MGSDIQFHATLILFFLRIFDLIANLLDVLSALRNGHFGPQVVFYIRPFATYDTILKDFNQLCAINKFESTTTRCHFSNEAKSVSRIDDLNKSTQRIVEILQIGEQLRHGWSIPGGTEPAGFHTSEELIGTRSRLSEPISVSETRHHLEWVYFYVRLLTQCRQFP